MKGEADDTGTIITFHPDPEIFQQTTHYRYDTLAARLRELAFLNKGINITLTDERELVDEFVKTDDGEAEVVNIRPFEQFGQSGVTAAKPELSAPVPAPEPEKTVSAQEPEPEKPATPV